MSDVSLANAPWWLRWLYLAMIFVFEFWHALVLLAVLCGLGWGMWVFGHQAPPLASQPADQTRQGEP